MKLLFSSDLHGNDGQYERLFNLAASEHVDAVLIGGDIAPKHLPGESFVAGQRLWYARLAEHLQRFAKLAPYCKVLVMMANDDAKCNLPILLRVLEENGALQLHGERHHFGEIDIVGYANVPVTPFPLKDWELNDVAIGSPHERLRSEQSVSYEGVLSSEGRWIQVRLPDYPGGGVRTIESELGQPCYARDPRRTVYVIHTPPAQTKLDLLWNGMHVGSAAVRGFIEERQPLLTLHGHIHETVEVSGDFKERIGETWVYSCGNYENTAEVAAILVDTERPGEGRRVVI